MIESFNQRNAVGIPSPIHQTIDRSIQPSIHRLHRRHSRHAIFVVVIIVAAVVLHSDNRITTIRRHSFGFQLIVLKCLISCSTQTFCVSFGVVVLGRGPWVEHVANVPLFRRSTFSLFFGKKHTFAFFLCARVFECISNQSDRVVYKR